MTWKFINPKQNQLHWVTTTQEYVMEKRECGEACTTVDFSVIEYAQLLAKDRSVTEVDPNQQLLLQLSSISKLTVAGIANEEESLQSIDNHQDNIVVAAQVSGLERVPFEVILPRQDVNVKKPLLDASSAIRVSRSTKGAGFHRDLSTQLILDAVIPPSSLISSSSLPLSSEHTDSISDNQNDASTSEDLGVNQIVLDDVKVSDSAEPVPIVSDTVTSSDNNQDSSILAGLQPEEKETKPEEMQQEQQQIKEQSEQLLTCSVAVWERFTDHVFLDPYQCRDALVHTGVNVISFGRPELEAPTFKAQQQSFLAEKKFTWNPKESLTVDISIPFHLRYQSPSKDESYRPFIVGPSPVLFVACLPSDNPVSNDFHGDWFMEYLLRSQDGLGLEKYNSNASASASLQLPGGQEGPWSVFVATALVGAQMELYDTQDLFNQDPKTNNVINNFKIPVGLLSQQELVSLLTLITTLLGCAMSIWTVLSRQNRKD